VAAVSGVGLGVTKFKAGDSVVCLAPAKFDSTFLVCEDICEKLLPNENAHEVVGLLVPHCTALRALVDIGRVKEGETVLINLSAEPGCIAAISIARMLGAKVCPSIRIKM
jgi:NADPH:quinone reductase-like Zn-dependent oxidoreductase